MFLWSGLKQTLLSQRWIYFRESTLIIEKLPGIVRFLSDLMLSAVWTVVFQEFLCTDPTQANIYSEK